MWLGAEVVGFSDVVSPDEVMGHRALKHSVV
jgi:hypothetical protein